MYNVLVKVSYNSTFKSALASIENALQGFIINPELKTRLLLIKRLLFILTLLNF